MARDLPILRLNRTASSAAGLLVVLSMALLGGCGDDEPASHTVTFVTDGTPGASLTGTNPQTVEHGSDSTAVTAVPPVSHDYVNWTLGGAPYSADNPLTVTGVTQDMTLTANFAIKTYTVTFQTDGTPGSSLTGASPQTVDHGSDCSPVTASVPSGLELGAWTLADSSIYATQNPLTATGVTSDMTLTANLCQPVFVKANATGANDGSSWADAYTDLEPAIAAVAPGQVIWVAAGTYKPTSDHGLGLGDRGKHFRLKNSVSVYGGFAGGETSRSQRNPGTNVTILSGDIGVPLDSSDNAYHVVVGADYAILDGFTVADGNASDAPYPNNRGGGMYCSGVEGLTVANCAFTNNSAARGGGVYNSGVTGASIAHCTFTGNVTFSWGGGICNDQSSPEIRGCSFTDNEAGDGGGIMNVNAAPLVENCTFTRNDAYSGGAMQNKTSSPTVTDCVFDANTGFWCAGLKFEGPCASAVSGCTFVANTSDMSGAMDIWVETCAPVVSNCLFVGNTSAGGGGAVRADSSRPTFLNCTFTANEADQGGAVHAFGDASLTFANCIVWDNLAVLDNPNFLVEAPATADVTFSCVEGGWAGAGNVGSLPEHDPGFVDTVGPDTIPGTLDDDLRLSSGSPCIDTGDDSALPADAADLDGDGDTTEPLPLDLDGNPRVSGSFVDMGAYEVQQ